MKSIAVTKPDMGVLSQDRLILSPFGALAQAFGEELLARAEPTEGLWSYVPLELLEEGEAPLPAAPTKQVLQVNLQLVLEALRREGQGTEQQRAAERILERTLQLQTRTASQGKKPHSARSLPQSTWVFAPIWQEFNQNFTQNIRISLPPLAQSKGSLGKLARQAETFSQRLQTLREEGAPPTLENNLPQGKLVPIPTGEAPPSGQVPMGVVPFGVLPQQALTLLEEQGDKAARAAAGAQSTQLLGQARRIEALVEDILEGSAKGVSRPSSSSREHTAPDFLEQPRRTTQRGEALENGPSTRTRSGSAPSQRPAVPGGQSGSAVHETPHTAPAAAAAPPTVPGGSYQQKPGTKTTATRDIRVTPDAPLGSLPAREPALPVMGQGAAAPMVPGQAAETSARTIPGQIVSFQSPVELTLRTQEETEQDFSTDSSRVARQGSQGANHSHNISSPVENSKRNTQSMVPKSSVSLEKPGRQTGPIAPQAPASEAPSTDETESSARSHREGHPAFHTPSQPVPQLARDIRVTPDAPLGVLPAREPASQMDQQAVAPMVPGQPANGTAPSLPGPGQLPVELTLRTEEEAAQDFSTGSSAVKRQSGQGEHSFHNISSPVENSRRNTQSMVPKSSVPSEKPGRQHGPMAPQALASEAPSTSEAESPARSHREGPPAFHTPSQPVPQLARDIRVTPDAPLGHLTTQGPASQAMEQKTVASMLPGPPAHGTAPVLPDQLPVELTLRTDEEAAQDFFTGASGVTGQRGQAGQRFHNMSSPVENPPQKTRSSGSQASFGETQARQEADAAAHSPQLARDIRVTPDIPLGALPAREPGPQAMGLAAPTAPGQPAHGTTSVLSGLGLLPVELTLRAEEPAEAGGEFPTNSPPSEHPAVGQSPAAFAPPGRPEGSSARPARPANVFRQIASLPHLSPPRTAARDIRTQSGLDHISPAGTGPEIWTVPSLPLTLSQSVQAGATPQPFPAGQTKAEAIAAGTARQEAPSMTEPLPLTYGPAQGAAAAPPPEPEASEPSPAEESDFVRSLPDWARRFLKQSRTPSAASHAMGVARDIAALPSAQQPEEVSWTAPNYQPPQAAMAHREKKQEERPKAVQEVSISEAEIQRTADRVYRIIEDRIRRERRRLGL